MLGEQIVVVEDDAVVDPDDRPVRRPGGCWPRSRDAPWCSHGRARAARSPAAAPRRGREAREAGVRCLTTTGVGGRGVAVGVADRVGAALGDPGEQRLGEQRPVQTRAGARGCSRRCRTSH